MNLSSIYNALLSVIRHNYNIAINTDNDLKYFGAYCPPWDGKPDEIVINPKLIKKRGFNCATTLLHEFGHFIKNGSNTNKYRNSRDVAYRKLFTDKKKLTPKQIKIVLDEERQAWVVGRKFCKKYFPKENKILSSLDREKSSAMKTYDLLIRLNQERIKIG